MAIFAYKALDSYASVVRGTIAADTPRQARDLLRAKGVTIQEVVQQKPARARGWGRLVARRHAASVPSFVLELATLLGVGIPLLEAIETIARQHRGGFKTVILLLRDRVSGGVGLAEAMREQPAVFDDLCVSITEVGESSGSLESALERLAEFKERSLQFKNRLAAALMYPCLVLVTGVVVSVFLMTFVVPGLLGALVESGRELPAATRLVKGASDLLVGWWWLLVIVVAVTSGVVVAIGRTRAGRLTWHRWVLRVPLVGQIIRKQSVGRVALVMATLMRSGVVFVRALQIAASGTHNLVLREGLERCEQTVCAGHDLGEAMEQAGVFPPAAVRVFAAGQQSGRLEEMLERLARDYDRQVAAVSQRLTAVLEPILILALAVIVGLIAFATMMPILEAGDVL